MWSVNCFIFILLRTTLGRPLPPWRRWSRWQERSLMAWPISTPTSSCTGTSLPGTAWWPRTSQSKLEVGCPHSYTGHRLILENQCLRRLLIFLFLLKLSSSLNICRMKYVCCEDLQWFKTCEQLTLSLNLWNTSVCCCSSEAIVQHVGLKRGGEAVI